MRKPLLYLARHGSTVDSGLNIFRGQRDSVLDKKGYKDAHELREFFDKHEWHRCFCTEMARAVQTATIICDDQKTYQPELIPNYLDPWDIGIITGKPKNDKWMKEIEYYDTHIDEAPESGESIRQFEERVWPCLASLIELGWRQGVPCICVAHSSIIHSLNHFLVGRDHEEIAVKPGGVIEVFMEDGEILHEAIFKTGHDDSSFQKS